jgi:hypothetical protein
LGENGDDGRTEVGDDAPGGDDGGVRAAAELRLLDPGAALRDGLLPRDGPGERGPCRNMHTTINSTHIQGSTGESA